MAGKLPADSFDFYVGLGAERSYQTVADHFGVTKRAVTKRASQERWQARVADLEATARRAAEKKPLETLEEMSVRHLKSLRVVQGRALETLRSTAIESAMDAVRALDMALKQERVIRGEPSECTAMTIAETTRDEIQRLLTVEEFDEDDDEENGEESAEEEA